jgi:hypothetical protein
MRLARRREVIRSGAVMATATDRVNAQSNARQKVAKIVRENKLIRMHRLFDTNQHDCGDTSRLPNHC